jgi:hypothetical protein
MDNLGSIIAYYSGILGAEASGRSWLYSDLYGELGRWGMR